MVNTPQNKVKGCSLSVKIPQNYLSLANKILARGSYPTCLVVVGLHLFFAVFFSVLNQISLETVACQTFGTVVFDNFVASVNQSVDSGSSNDLELQFEVVLFVFSGFLGTIFFQTYDIGRIDCRRTGVSRIKIDVKVEKDVLHGEGGSV